MTAEMLLPYDAPREVWLQARTAGIGGSDALACLGLDPCKTRLEVYLDKLGAAPEREQTDRMRWGQIVEAAILEWFVERTGIKVQRRGLLRSLERPWQLASLDAEADDGGIVEIKNTNHYRRGEWDDEQVADGAEAQSQHYLDVTGRSHAWIVAQVGGEPPVIRRVERDEELIGHIRAAELELWGMVQARTAPPLEGGRASELVDRLFPTGVPGKRIDVDLEFMVGLREYLELRASEKAAEKAKKELGAQLALEMGDATEAYYRGQLIATRNNQTRTSASVAALRERHPEAAADVVTETSFRVLRPKIKES